MTTVPEQASPVDVVARSETRSAEKRWPVRIAGALLSVFMFVLIGAGALFALLSRGPMELAFLSERVSSALEAQIGNGVDADVGRTLLERTENGIALHIQDVTIKDRTGQTILQSPDALVSFDPLKLLALSLVPKRLEFRGMTIRASIAKDGDVSFSAGSNSANQAASAIEPAASARISQGLAALALLARRDTAAEWMALRVDDATLLVDDQRLGRQTRFDQLSLQFENPEQGVARARGSLSRNNLAIPFLLEIKTVAANYTFTLETSNVSDEVIASAIGLAELPVSSNGTLAGRMQILADPQGNALNAEAKIILANGSVAIKGIDEKPFLVREAVLQAKWNGGLTQIDNAALSIKGDEYNLSIAGNVSLPKPADPWFRFRGTGKDWTLSGLSASDPAIAVDDVSMAVSVKEDGHQIILDSMQIKGAQTDIALTGQFQRRSDGPNLEARAILGAMPVRNAIRWWPRFLVPYTRNYFADAVLQGRLTRLDVAMNLPAWKLNGTDQDRPLPPEALRLEAAVEGVTAQVATGLPPLVGISGVGRMNARQAEGTASTARLDLRNNKSIPISEGSFVLSGLETYQPRGTFGFRAQTPLENVAELLKAPALKDAFATGFDPQSLKGQFDGRGKITLPLTASLTPRNVTTEFQGKMTAVTLENAIGKDKLDNATLNVVSDASGFEIKGDGRWQNIPVGVTLERDAQDGSSAAVLSFSLDDAALKRFGIDIGQAVTAPVPVKIKTSREQGAALKASIEADLTRNAFDGLFPGFRKAAGRPAKLVFDAREKQGGYSLQNISLESGISSFKGNAEVSNGAVTSARLSLFRLSPGDNTRLDYDRTATGRKITIRGNNFDARPFLKLPTKSSAANTGNPTRGASTADEAEIDLKTTLLTGFGGEVITNAELQMVRKAETLRQFSLNGKINGKKVQISGKNLTEASAPLVVDVDDAGAFLRYIDMYSRMVGGQLDGLINPSPGRTTGVILARNFSLQDEPAIRRLVQETPTATATATQAELTRSQNSRSARFTKMRLSFAQDGSRTTISDAVIFGPEIGLTFNGLVDSERDRISMSGTFVPAYGLNNAFSQIPVLGGLLTGARNEGVLAVTFGVSGRASAPSVTINPLSAITPGIFRKIFEFRNETTGSSVVPNN